MTKARDFPAVQLARQVVERQFEHYRQVMGLDKPNEEDIVYRLRRRAEIRMQASTRKSVQEGKPDRLADLLNEAAQEIERLRKELKRETD